jgi:hypothetical protein
MQQTMTKAKAKAELDRIDAMTPEEVRQLPLALRLDRAERITKSLTARVRAMNALTKPLEKAR